jgi:hypothetical protein
MLCASICIFFVLTQGSIDVMGNKNTANVKVSSAITPTKTNSPIINDLSEPEKERKYRLLCLHGWRTSGEIFSYQMASLSYHASIDGTFPDAPFTASGKNLL